MAKKNKWSVPLRDKGSVPRKRGAPKGNKNAVGGRGNPKAKPPDATKHGGYSAVYWDTLDEDEKNLIEDMPKDEEELLIEQIQLFSVRGTTDYESNQQIPQQRKPCGIGIFAEVGAEADI